MYDGKRYRRLTESELARLRRIIRSQIDQDMLDELVAKIEDADRNQTRVVPEP